VEAEAVVEALVDEVLERPAGLRRALGVERDLEVAAVGAHGRDVGSRRVELLLRLLEVDVLRRGRLGLLAAGPLLAAGVLGRRRLGARRLVLVVAAAGQRQAGEQQREEPPHGRR
jgi:hypothetical protein